MRTRIARIGALLSLAIWTTAQAAAPPLLPLQGVLTDADGVPLAAAVTLRFSLHTAETAGSEVWSETQTITPVDGLFAAYLGQGTGSTMTLATFRDEGELWLEVKVGADPPMARVRLASVAYAAYAEYCGNIPAHTHPATDLPAGVVIGAQACGGSDKVRGVAATGAIVCAPDLGTGPDTLGQLNCTSGQTVKWNGSIWGCANDLNSGGTITAVNAGDGLVSSTTGTAATLSIQACGEEQVLRTQTGQWQCSPAVQAITTPAAGGLAFSTTGATYTLTLRAGCTNGQILKYNSGTASWDCAGDANAGGDITAVNTAVIGGLTGGSTTGDVNLSLRACAVGQILKYNSATGWDCAADNDTNSGGTVTSVATGAGLTGGPITGSGTIAIATGGVTNAMLANGGVTVSAGTGLSGGGAVALGGTTTISLATPVSVANGGTNAATPAGARTSLGAAASAANTDITSLTGLTAQNAVQLGPWGAGAGNTGEARFLELAANGTNYVGFKAPDALAASVLWSLPTADGAANQVLRTDGAGRLSWASPSGGSVTSVATGQGLTGGPITGSGTISIPNGGVTNALLQNSGVTVGTGAGLSGGGAVALGGSLNLSIPNAGVNNAMLANSSLDVTAGSGLSGGGTVALGGGTTLAIADAGVTNAMLANSSLGVTAGTGLSGGGTVGLGGSTSLEVSFAGSGAASTVARSDHNHDGTYVSNLASGAGSVAVGTAAVATDAGCFVWGDSDITGTADCTGPNQFVARASGGVTLYTDGAMTVGATLAAGTSAWAVASDRNLKRDFEPVDARSVLARVVDLPMSTWRYKTEVSGARHMGPMAQDFHAAFGLGDSDRHITTVDADGVALAAIQGLHQADGELRAENARLREQVRGLEGRVAQLGSLEQRLAKLEQARPAGANARDLGLGGLGLLMVGGLVVARRRRTR